MTSLSIGTTDVDICARALVNIGMKPIDNLSGDDDVTRACTLLYPMVKKEVLSMYPWWCTKSKVRLNRLTDTPVNEYKYGFQLPSNRLSGPLAIYNSADEGAIPIKSWDIFGEEVLSNEESLWGNFQFDIDESKFTPYIENLIIYILSARLAESLTDDSSKADKYDFIAFGNPGEKRQGGYFETAKTIDSRFRPNQAIDNFPLTDVRGS